MKRIFITGVSGCIGHYLAEALLPIEDYELFLLARNPQKLRFNPQDYPRVHLIPGDLAQIEDQAELLKTMDCAVLIATSWGDPQETFQTNVVKTLTLMNLLDPDRCEQIIYFSTASILDRQGNPLPEAGELGTDYIRTKYLCHQALSGEVLAGDLTINPLLTEKITVVYPTLVFGGAGDKPYSHLSGGLGEILNWLNLIRWFQADGSFHFIHARDIARVVAYLIAHPQGRRQDWVLGNAPLTVKAALAEICAYLGKPVYFQIPLSIPLANFFIRLFRIEMAPWDRFCLNYRHFTYPNPVNPDALGLESYSPTVARLMEASGIISGKTGPTS
ncbi:MAG: NAD(P)-dependent oxidoreductase [Cyanobacteriota bacterium]|nr:NAD(P)-dependent oxidoreductase [Cyanobacteriota bacterium]